MNIFYGYSDFLYLYITLKLSTDIKTKNPEKGKLLCVIFDISYDGITNA